METTERDIKRQVTRWLDKLEKSGAIVTCPYNPYYGEAGWPDRIGMMPVKITQGMVGKTVGVFIGIEFKRSGRKLSPVQRVRRSDIRKFAGVYCTVRSLRDAKRWATVLLRQYDLNGGQTNNMRKTLWQSNKEKK